MDNLEYRKKAEAYSYGRMGTALLKGSTLSVNWIPEDQDDLGYTMGGKPINVFVNWRHHEIAKGLDEDEATLLRMGVFAHETLHQCFTNFDYTNKVCKDMSRGEAAIFMQFANTLEDPAIEYFAPNVFGGNLLEALRFSIQEIYKKSPGIDKSQTAFGQLINALIQFGDMGMIKGKFTFPEAYEAFKRVAPLYNEGITCPDSKRRIDIAKECMDLTKDIWADELKNHEEMEKLMKAMEEFLKKLGKHLFGGIEKKMQGKDQGNADERRSSILKKISTPVENEESEESEGSEGSDSASGGSSKKDAKSKSKNGRSNSSESEDADKTDDKSEEAGGSGKGEKEEEESDKSSGSSESDDKADASNKSDDDSKSSSSNQDGKAQDTGEGDNDDLSSCSITTEEAEANETAESEYTLDEDTVQKILKEIEDEESAMKKADAENRNNQSLSETELPDFDITSPALRKVKCDNVTIRHNSLALSNMYSSRKSILSGRIKNVKKSLEKIFDSDKEENHRATSGSYNIMRGSIGTTARMFDKKKDPGNLRDAAVMLCIDNSGSMHNDGKIEEARDTAIVLAEALSELKIPYYIMGYTTHSRVHHNHYVGWNGNKNDRETLCGMVANGGNMDGYSIRYAAKLLQMRPESNKLMFIISDGEPSDYNNRNEGIADTIHAVRDARKIARVFGIALGRTYGVNTIQSMYGKDFIWCEDPCTLSNVFCKKLIKCLSKKG